MARIFAEQGLVVMDAASREFHALGASTLRFALEHATELQVALIARNTELMKAGYHAQVLVTEWRFAVVFAGRGDLGAGKYYGWRHHRG